MVENVLIFLICGMMCVGTNKGEVEWLSRVADEVPLALCVSGA